MEVARALMLRWAPGREPRAHIVDLTAVVASLRARAWSRGSGRSC